MYQNQSRVVRLLLVLLQFDLYVSRLYTVIPSYLPITNWHLPLTPKRLMPPTCCALLFSYVVTAHCSSLHVIIATHSAKRTAYCLSSRKVDCTPFQQLYHDYVNSARDFIPLTLSIPLVQRPFYNSKSSIPNGSASPFGRITFRPLFFAMALRSPLLSAAAAAGTRPHQIPGRSPSSSLLGEADKFAGEAPGAHRFCQSSRSRTKPYRVTPNSKPIRNSNAKLSELAFRGKNHEDSRAYAVSIWNKTKPCTATPGSKPIQSNAKLTAQSSPSDERITRILEPLPIAKLSCAESAELLTSIRRCLGLAFIPWAPESNIRQSLSQGCRACSPEQDTRRLRHSYKCDADRASERSDRILIFSEIQALFKALWGLCAWRPRWDSAAKNQLKGIGRGG